ncbi:TonB-dependent receptor [Novosphingobium sp. Rr 2-17]|uniref:TonB-dependent receptor plug domain-containing protein n=1 Tax=Novosphingobium sp. Rr 2-17 TaxID=555793 RepID=UPI0002698BC2|nr:TonB-dependent receptor [Novosphingobium sp. Rr 2-17]EIZ78624.1 TonB-dependent receptor [Novosphingobium sp. Rr 2-17]
MKTSIQKAALCGATSLSVVALLCGTAHAQDTAAPQVAEAADEPASTIIVTGSISRNPAAATASPVVSITSEDMSKRGITTTSELLQSLTANNAGTVASSWSSFGFTTGASAPSLRGFNDAYTLVLFDGMRTAYFPLADDTQRNIVDINTIPTSIIDRTDVLLDGASATYGSDAIAGVVNLLTKRQITGFHADASGGISQRGDSGEQRINATYGYGDLDEQGFNIYVNGEYQHNSALYMRDRGAPFNTADQSSICGTAEQGCLTNSIRNGIQYDGSYNGFQSTTANAVRPYSTSLTSLGGYQYLNGCNGLDSTTLTADQRAVSGSSAGQPITPSTVCQQDLVNQYRMYSPEITRKGATLRATFKVGDSSEAFVMFNYYNTKTYSSTTPSGWTGQTAASSDQVTVNSIYLPVYVCSQGTGSLDASGRLTASGCNASNGTLNPNNPFASQGNLARLVGIPENPRETYTDAKTYRASAGIQGSFSDGFDYNVGATASQINMDITNKGYVNLQGLMDAIAQGTYNFVDPSQNSEAAIQQVFPDQKKRATSKLAQIMGTLSKDLFALPGGKVNVAVGGQYRHESIDNPSANPANPENPYDRYYSINGVGVEGSRNIWSLSYEVSAPIFDSFRVRALGSYDHYSTGQKAFAPKFEAEFKPIEQIKLRGTFSKGFRAPNLNESFQQPATGYATYQINCSSPTYATFCAQHASNPNYYSAGYSIGLTSESNANLKPEKSTSYTLGLVVQPVRNVTLTVDYWHTKIKNVIVAASVTSDILEQYYNNNGQVNVAGVTVTPGVADSENPNALPLIGYVTAAYRNANALQGSGIDFSADASFPLSETVKWFTKANLAYMIRLEQFNEDGSVWRYDGSLGGCNVTSCSGTPRWRATWQNTLDFNNKASLTLTATYTSGYSSVATDSGGVYGDCAASATNGQQVTYDNGDPVQCRTKPVFYLDTHGEVKVADKFTLYADMLNILDTKAKYDPNSAYGLYQFNPAWSDRLFVGRYLRIGAKVDF